MPTAFITGITGQDGSYLAQLLLEKGYTVVGMVSPKHDIGDHNIASIKSRLILEAGDLLDRSSLEQIILKHEPDEVYNLAGMTFIPTSWDKPALVYDVNAMGVLRLLEIIRDQSPVTKFFQASSAKMFDMSHESSSAKSQHTNNSSLQLSENSPLYPQDPYAVSKLAAHHSVRLFRDHFQLFACSGTMFNHESEKRGPEFVTRKITQGAVKIKLGLEKSLSMGNLDAQQDWGYAPDYVQGFWLMLQQPKPDDYVFATGELHSVREICEIAFKHLGLDYQKFVTMDQQFYRPAEKGVCGDPTKAQTKLGWKRTVGFREMIVKMVEEDQKTVSSL